MRKRLLSVGAVALVALVGVVVAVTGVGRAPVARAAAAEPAWDKFKYEGASTCASCHALPRRIYPGALDFVLLTEYAIWATHDKHAQAYAVLKGKRGQRMGELLKVDVTKPEAGCLSCHAMYNQWMEGNFEGKDYAALSDAERTELTKHLQDGVSCGGCHGPSSDWNPLHSKTDWRKNSPKRKHDLGMADLRDPAARSELCMSCHIGNAAEGKVVSHAMFAAGHPPLPPIEIATFSKNQPQHWRDAADVPAFSEELSKKYEISLNNYHATKPEYRQTRFALIGNVVALRETMKLARDRSGAVKDMPRWAWPELAGTAAKDLPAEVQTSWTALAMAHSDCYACHHELRYPGFRTRRGFGYRLPGRELFAVKPGRPVLRTWSLPVLEADAGFVGSGAELNELADHLKGLAGATSVQNFGTPGRIAGAAAPLIKWCDGMAAELDKDGLYDEASILKLLHGLCDLYAVPPGTQAEPGSAIPDYETARQLASTIRVAFNEWARRRDGDARVREVRTRVAQMTAQLQLEPYIHRDDRIDVLMEVIRKAANIAPGAPGIDKGIAQFKEYLKPENMGSKEKLNELIDTPNLFLVRLGIGLDPEKFTQELITPRIANKLQQFSDQEGEALLNKMANFNPDQFQATLFEIKQQLPPAR